MFGDAFMEKAFDKLGLYDFMGIFGAGIVIFSYYLVTSVVITELNVWDYIKSLQVDFSLLVIFCVCIFSYVIGLYVHEIGKRFCEVFQNIFEIQNRCDVKSKYKMIKGKKTILKVLADRIYIFIHPIQYRRYYLLKQTENLTYVKRIDEEISYLKYKNHIRIIEKYHSLYGMTRGIWIGFVLHTVILIICLLVNKHIISTKIIYVLVFDILSIALFYVRIHRYYISWLKNIFIQYDLCMKKEDEERDTNELN